MKQKPNEILELIMDVISVWVVLMIISSGFVSLATLSFNPIINYFTSTDVQYAMWRVFHAIFSLIPIVVYCFRGIKL